MTDQIIQFVTARTGITREQIESPTRKREWVQARQALTWLLRKHTDLSLNAIGAIIGGRDHSTVIHSVEAVDDALSFKWNKTFKWVHEFKFYSPAPMWEDEVLMEVCG